MRFQGAFYGKIVVLNNEKNLSLYYYPFLDLLKIVQDVQLTLNISLILNETSYIF